jgi:gluconolactonase
MLMKSRFASVVCSGFFAFHTALQAAGVFNVLLPAEFSKVVDTNTAVLTTNATINYWLEGPVWVPADGGYLIFSSMGSNNRLKKLVPPNTVSNFLIPPANTLYNGNTLDVQERLISCQGGAAGLRVVMVTNGVVTPLVSTCNGLKFYSPNDVVVKSDGTVWFTDPGYNGGVGSPPQPGFQGGYYVYRFNPTNGNATCTPVITNALVRPNGICFSPDESLLYVADADTARHHIRVYSVSASNTLSGGSVFATISNGIPDGIRCDVAGRVYSSAENGVHIFLPDGRLIGRIIIPNTVANLCFGGPDWKTLYLTAQPRVYSIPLKVAGAASLKKLRVTADGARARVTWPAPSTGFQLETSGAVHSGLWAPVADVPVVTNGLNTITFEATNAAAFFRLNKPVS